MSANLSALLYLVAGVLFILSLRGLSSPASSRQGNLFGWIIPTLRTSEFTVLQTVGLDAAVLLNFYRMAFFLFTLLACLAGAVLMPLNLFRHGSTESEYDPPVNGNDTVA